MGADPSMRGIAPVLVLVLGGMAAEARSPFVLGVEYTETGLAPIYGQTGVTSTKTRAEAFAWGAVEPSPPVAGRHTYDWGCTDALVGEYQRAGLVDVQSYVTPKSSWGSVSAGDIMPKPALLADYRAWLAALVERYDGDGVADMPGLLAPVRRWVIGAEWTGFWPSGNADDYLVLLEASASAIRGADPAAIVGLVPFLLFDVFEGNVPAPATVEARLLDPPPAWRKSTAGMLKMLGRPELFDEVNVHSLGDYTELPPLLSWMKARMAERGYERPVFVDDAFPISFLANYHPLPGVGWPAVYPVTEARYQQVYQRLLEVARMQEPAYGTALRWIRAETAAGLVRKVATAAGEGYAGIQMGNTEDWMPDEGTALRELTVNFIGAAAMMGLVDATHPKGSDFCRPRGAGAPRPGWRNLKLVAEALAGFTRAERLSGLPSNVFAYRFSRPSGGWVTVAWHESGLALPGETPGRLDVDLPVSATVVNVTAAVTRDTAAPIPVPLAATSGRVRLTLTSVPVFVTPAGAATAVERLPVVLSSPGANGSFFTSELALVNRGTTDATVRLQYTAGTGGGSGEALDTLPAGRQRIVPDAIAYLRDLGLSISQGGSHVGTLTVRCEGLSHPGAAGVSVRTTTATGPGRAGLAYAGAAPRYGPVTIWGLRQDAADRSNVTVVHQGEPGSGPLTLRLTVLSADPAAPAARSLPDVTLQPGELAQISGVLAREGLTRGAVRVEPAAPRPDAPSFTAYGVINDQTTSDGSFVPPWPDGLSPASLTLPVVVESAEYTSDVVLANGSGEVRRIRLTFTSEALPPPGEVSVPLELSPGSQLVIPAFVAWLRERTGLPGPGPLLAGPVFLTPDGGGTLEGVFAGARTSTAGGGGRYGLFAAATPAAALAPRSAFLYGLRQDAESRTNLALVNAGVGEAVFRVELVDGATGAVAGTIEDVRVAGRRWRQLDAVLSRVPGLANAYARVVLVSGAGPFLAYAVVNDGARPGERTGDGALVEMAVEE